MWLPAAFAVRRCQKTRSGPLMPLLMGKVLEAHTAIDEAGTNHYKELKESWLAKFDMTPEMNL